MLLVAAVGLTLAATPSKGAVQTATTTELKAAFLVNFATFSE